MPQVNTAELRLKAALVSQLELEFSQWRPHYQQLARFILPRRYSWLTQTKTAGLHSSASSLAVNASNRTADSAINTAILDGTGTEAARTLAHGLMSGITSPSRQWFKLRLQEPSDDEYGYPIRIRRWLEDTTNRLLAIMAGSNFYNAMGLVYLDLSVFGSAAMIIYEDFDEVIRCYHSPVGEFRFLQDNRRFVDGMARTIQLTVRQIVEEFGIENCSDPVKAAARAGGAQLLQTFSIVHLIERNTAGPMQLANNLAFREIYWEEGRLDGNILRLAGFQEQAHVGTRWDLTGTDTYGTSPGMDALADIKQLQVEVKQKAQALDRMIRPPLVADVALSTQQDSLLPGGLSFVPSHSSVGARPIYTVNPPLGEMSNDITLIREAIRRYFYNNLFRNVSNLSTVRSAAEIYERKAEDMVMLGPVLERFENEALDPIINRIYQIARRKGLLLDPPEELDSALVGVKYESIFADAQRNIGSSSTERAWQTVGNLAAARPEILDILDWDESVRHYFNQVGVPALTIRPRSEVTREREARQQQLDAQQAAVTGNELAKAAQNLSQTQLGAGSALDELL